MMRANEDNTVCVSGMVCEDALLDHELYGEAFYALRLQVERLSGVADILPVTLPARICPRIPQIGDRIRICGQLRSYNKHTDGANRLVITVFAKAVEPISPEEVPENSIQLIGFICKPVVYRTTPFLREIGDMLLAVNRSYNKSDYLPL
ncbi:MAG: single-stranded DNA-binding protein, partial [Clostridia bacterium]|nr:single-stranded DNA-binding protein [Clostridia bacterium]